MSTRPKRFGQVRARDLQRSTVVCNVGVIDHIEQVGTGRRAHMEARMVGSGDVHRWGLSRQMVVEVDDDGTPVKARLEETPS